MKTGKMALMTGVAAIAMVAAASAQAADNSKNTPNLVLAQNITPSSSPMTNAELAARVQALEDAQATQSDRAMSDRTRLSTLEQGYNSAR
jgi:hypothetical protein